MAEKQKPKGFECKHAIYRKSLANPNDDVLMVKEIIHNADGTTTPNIRLFNNYERDFWVTRKGFQTYKDKREWEDLKKLDKYRCTQSQLMFRAAKALEHRGHVHNLRQLARSPFLYGCDITTPVLIKQKYMSSFPDCITENRVAVLDIETNVAKDSKKEILMASLTSKEKAYTAVTKAFLGSTVDPIKKIHEMFNEYLGDMTMPDPKNKGKTIQVNIVKERGIKLDIEIFDTPGEVAAATIRKAHEWKPDIVSVWNIDFDLSKLIEALERENYDLGDVFSDPCIPKDYRTMRYIRGQAQRVTASGKVFSLHMAERWHTVDAMSSFYWFCSMATYRKLRVAKGNEPSYALDAILDKHLGIRKLKFKEADHVSGLAWHQLMQRDYKIQYIIYNLFDCISVELLDEKIGDLSKAVSALCGISEYAKFPSQPRRLVDNLHFKCLEEGAVIGTTSDQMVDENDKLVVGVEDWIVTLPSNLVEENGIRAIRELPGIRSAARIHVADLDCVSTYPSVGWCANIAKETTYRELSSFRDIPEEVQRVVSINYTAGVINAAEISRSILNYPSHDQLLDGFREQLKKAA